MKPPVNGPQTPARPASTDASVRQAPPMPTIRRGSRATTGAAGSPSTGLTTLRVPPAPPPRPAWVRRSGTPGRWLYVLSKGSVGCDRSAYGLYSGWSGGLSFYVASSTHYTISPEAPASVIWDGAWHHEIGGYGGARG